MEKYEVMKFLKNKKFQWSVAIVLFLVVLIIGVHIRTLDLPNLIDSTTGDYTPLALDPYYFLRMSETLLANDWVLPKVDTMRYPALKIGWSTDLTPYATVWIYKIMNYFDDTVTLNYANVLNPVIFFALALVGFFLLAYVLSKSKWVAVISSAILVVIPPYLYRTLAGFSDHESIGMLGFFFSIMFFSLGMFGLEDKKSKKYFGLIALLSGVATMFAVAAWAGGGKFLFMTLPLAYFVTWFIKKEKNNWDYILFYSLWLIGILASAPLFKESVFETMTTYMLNSTGILTLIALGYSIIETLLIKYEKKLGETIKKYRVLVSFGILIVLGILLYEMFIGSAWSLIKGLIERIVNPFGKERVTVTVAENKQPYLDEWISQITKPIFYIFLLGNFFVGLKISSGIKKKKPKYLFLASFIFFVVGILFSRISSSSMFNGENFLSKAFVFISAMIFLGISIYAYFKSDWDVNVRWIILAAWMIPMLLAVRSAIRVFFAIVPFVALIVPLVIFEFGNYWKKSKDNLVKILLILAVILFSIILIFTLNSFYKSTTYQAKSQIPSYNQDWQQAMSWVRDNTTEGSIFLHWWDYGYWVQTGGNRPTVTDGGHGNAYWDHLIGRYVLTTPYPETAKSFMKTHNASYLLIDPTDIGKYSAYSSIGDAKEISDRASWMPMFTSNMAETKETNNGTIRLYRGGYGLDEDITYGETFLPAGNSAIGAIILEKEIVNATAGTAMFKQPRGVFINENQIQKDLPLRYLFIQGNLIDFGGGVEATVYVYPNVVSTNAGQQFDLEGAAIYLSRKTKDSLVAKLYLMDDPKGEYPELDLVHSQGAYNFPFYYQGFRGPIKIWKINLDEMDDIIAREEFTAKMGEYGEFDGLQFIK